MMTIGEKIKKLRGNERRAKIARAAKCSAPTIREIESDSRKDPSFRIIVRLADYFQVPLPWLADNSSDWPPPPTQDQKIAKMVGMVITNPRLENVSEQERFFLAALRMLPEKRQAEVLGFIKGLADADQTPHEAASPKRRRRINNDCPAKPRKRKSVPDTKSP